jgi:hypothetical protein
MTTRIVIILLSLILLLLVVLWVGKQMLSFTPDPSSFHPPVRPATQTPMTRKEETNDKSPSSTPSQMQPVLSAGRQEVLPHVLEQLEGDYRTQIKPAIPAHRLSVHQGQLVAELIVETDHLPLQDLSPQGQRIAIKLKALAQKANLNKFYIKFQSRPIIKKGLIIFPVDSRITLGKVVLPWSDLQKKYGKIDTLQLAAFGIDSMAITDDDVLIWPRTEPPLCE